MPYAKRKKALRKLLSKQGLIGFVESFDDPALFQAAVGLDIEGVVAKRKNDTYSEATEWLKIKNPQYSQAEGRWEFFERSTRSR